MSAPKDSVKQLTHRIDSKMERAANNRKSIMRGRNALALSVLPLLLAGAAVAQDAAPAPAKTAKPPREKKVCRSEQVTGSLLPSTTCHTKAEWTAIDDQQREATRQSMNGHSMAPPR